VRLERPLFDSRLARRVFATFLLASLVPLLALAFLLLQEVGRALEDQAFKQLENTTRSYGQFTLDKMLFAGDSLQEGVALATSAASTSPFDAVTLVDHGEQRPLVGAARARSTHGLPRTIYPIRCSTPAWAPAFCPAPSRCSCTAPRRCLPRR